MHSEGPRGESKPQTEQQSKVRIDRFPTPEDWIALQGGKPRVFRLPLKPKHFWRVVHVYEEHGDPEHRFKSGIIVETAVPEKINLLVKGGQSRGEDGELIQRDFVVPSFMDRNVHGDICTVRSIGARGETYSRINNQPQYERFLNDLQHDGWQELRFGVTQSGFELQELSAVRPSRPLDQAG